MVQAPCGALSNDGGSDPKWRHDGRELFYVAADGTLMAVEVNATATAFTADAPQRLFQTHRSAFRGPQMFTNYAPASDGLRFLVNRLADDRPRLPIAVVSNWTIAVNR